MALGGNLKQVNIRLLSFRHVWPRVLFWVLLAVVVMQAVRLAWTVMTPVGPLGDWRGREAAIPSASARASLFRSFDPFYPSPDAGQRVQNVTSLTLKLFGIRINEASGAGAAIIADKDGMQNSYAVGDEILPGVLLKAVAFDHVVIDRNGIEENMFIDQSKPVAPSNKAAVAGTAGDNAALGQPGVSGGMTVDALKAGIGFGPRMKGSQITGIVLSQKGPGFTAAGFHSGDVITQINGKAITSADDLGSLQREFVPGARISLMVERGAQVVPIAIMVQDK